MIRWTLVFLTVFTNSAQAAWTSGTYRSPRNPAIYLNYKLYLPTHSKPHSGNGMPLVVGLHGCKQDASRFAAVTRFAELAETEGFAVLIPEQSILYNADHCWNWFFPMNQMRGTGEASLIVGATQSTAHEFGIDPARIYLVGLSSGAAMANNLAACYRDVYAAVAAHSGLEYLAASTIWDTSDVLVDGGIPSPRQAAEAARRCGGPTDGTLMPAMILHGSSDVRVNPVNSDQTYKEYQIFNDLLDDDRDNRSVPHRTTSVEDFSPPGKYSYRVESVEIDGYALIKNVTVNGMAHSWSGGAPGFPNSDPNGPDATRMIWKFVSQFRRGD